MVADLVEHLVPLLCEEGGQPQFLDDLCGCLPLLARLSFVRQTNSGRTSAPQRIWQALSAAIVVVKRSLLSKPLTP